MENNSSSTIKYDKIYSDKFKKCLSDENIFKAYLEMNKEYLIEFKNEKSNLITKENHIIDYLIDLHDNNILVFKANVGHNRKRNKIHAFLSFSVSERYYEIVCKAVENLFNRGFLKDFHIERILSEDEFEDDDIYIDKFTLYPIMLYPQKRRSYEHLKEITDYIIKAINESNTQE
jgi:hypothetical protein